MDNRKKLKVSLAVTVVFLFASLVYRASVSHFYTNPDNLPDAAKGKNVVSVWVKYEFGADDIRARVEKYNKENNNNIYIDFKTYKKDYYNLLRLSMLSRNKPDIFQFGFYDFLENNNLYSLNELGINQNEIDKNRFLYYKGIPMGVKVFGNDVKLLINRDIFRESGLNPDSIPETWDDIIKYSRVIKAKFPDVVPFEFPLKDYAGIKISIGETSVNSGSIYTSFWDYKNKRYDFSFARGILSVYNKMYSEGLIPEEFYLKDKEIVKNDFYDKKAAMIISTYEDKTYFDENPPGFNIDIYDLPGDKLDKTFYYVDGINCLAAAKNDGNRDSVKMVYEWLIGQYNDINSAAAKQGGLYQGYEKRDNFKYEEKDPTDTLDINHRNAYKYFYDAISGKIKIDEAVDNLNKFYNYFVDYRTKIEPSYFDNYVEKE